MAHVGYSYVSACNNTTKNIHLNNNNNNNKDTELNASRNTKFDTKKKNCNKQVILNNKKKKNL